MVICDLHANKRAAVYAVLSTGWSNETTAKCGRCPVYEYVWTIACYCFSTNYFYFQLRLKTYFY